MGGYCVAAQEWIITVKNLRNEWNSARYETPKLVEKKGTYTCGVANSGGQLTAHGMFTAKEKKTYSKLKLGSQNGCGPRIIQICNDRFYTSEEHTLNSSHTAGLGLLLRASKMAICATTLGPVYTETSCTGKRVALSAVSTLASVCVRKKFTPLHKLKASRARHSLASPRPSWHGWACQSVYMEKGWPG